MTIGTIDLQRSTGYQNVDELLRGLIGIFEIVFPDRIRGYYLLGSYSDGTAVPDSDIDMGILFKGKIDSREEDVFWQLVQHCSRISPIRLDLGPPDEDHFLKEASAGI